MWLRPDLPSARQALACETSPLSGISLRELCVLAFLRSSRAGNLLRVHAWLVNSGDRQRTEEPTCKPSNTRFRHRSPSVHRVVCTLRQMQNQQTPRVCLPRPSLSDNRQKHVNSTGQQS